ncbi:MAG: tail fiber domain-containing protein [Flavobacteriales bacterium]|nr:tail fiber domain-containing protein [Flavobacteriales bacterium]
MGFVVDTVKSVGKAIGGVGDTLGGKAAYNPDEAAFKNAEINKQIALANQGATVSRGQSNLAEQQQIEARAKEIQLAQALGIISQDQAAIALSSLAEQGALAQQQQANINALTAQAEGQGPSLAQDFLTNATDRANKQILGQIASQRGVQPGQSLRVGLNTIGASNQQAASDAATLKLQEQMAARQQLAGALANTRGQAAEQGSGATSAQLAATGQQSSVVGNTRAQDLQSKQLAEEAALKKQTLATSSAEANRQAQIEKERIKAGLASDARKAQSELTAGIGGAAAAAASDKNLKKDEKIADMSVKNFLDALKAHEYKYKEEAQGLPGVDNKKHISPMAQEFEKSDMGKGMVVDTPEGKIVDYAKSAGALFASLAHINDRLKKIEEEEKNA